MKSLMTSGKSMKKSIYAAAGGMTEAEVEAEMRASGRYQWNHRASEGGASTKKGYSWGTTKREKKVEADGPAPGEYEIKSRIIEGP